MNNYSKKPSGSHKGWVVVLLLAFLGTVYFLSASGFVGYSRYMSIVFALPLSFLFLLRLQQEKDAPRQISTDDKELRRLLDEHMYEHMAYRYGNRKKAFGTDSYGAFSGLDLAEITSTPMVILLCLCVASMTFIEPIYVEFDPKDFTQLPRLFFVSFFQLIFFSAAFDGLILIFKNRRSGK